MGAFVEATWIDVTGFAVACERAKITLSCSSRTYRHYSVPRDEHGKTGGAARIQMERERRGRRVRSWQRKAAERGATKRGESVC